MFVVFVVLYVEDLLGVWKKDNNKYIVIRICVKINYIK